MTTHTQNTPKKLVIIGGGFAGISLARHIGKDARFDVRLVSETDQFRYYPALYRSATGYSKVESSIPMQTLLFDKPSVAFVQQKVTKIDSKKHVITCENGERIAYDIAVLALGVVTSYFGIEGLEKYSYGIKSIEAVTKLRKHLHDELVQTGHLDRQYVVVGAGPTGVELSAALISYLRRTAKQHHLPHEKVTIDLVEAAPRILPRMTSKSAELVGRRLKKLGVRVITGKTVQAETPTSLMVDGRLLPTETVIWTAGVTNNPFFTDNADQFTFDPHHRVVVDEHMQAAQDIYVLGDNAATKYGGLAETAVSDGVYLARNLKRLAAGNQAKPYRPRLPIVVIPVGENWSIVEYGSFVVSGWLGSLIRKAADLVGYMDIAPFFMALTLWFASSDLQEDCDICRKSSEHG